MIDVFVWAYNISMLINFMILGYEKYSPKVTVLLMFCPFVNNVFTIYKLVIDFYGVITKIEETIKAIFK